MLFTNCGRKLLLHRSIFSLNFYSNMATTHPPFLQVLAASVTAVNKAGDLIRDIMAGGKLDIVEKENANDLQVSLFLLDTHFKVIFTPFFFLQYFDSSSAVPIDPLGHAPIIVQDVIG